MDNIRDTLLNDRNTSYATINLKTDIKEYEYEKLTFLIKMVNDSVTMVEKKTKHYIDIRYNSPYEVFIKIFSEPFTLMSVVGIIYCVFHGTDAIFDRIMKYKLSKAEIDNKRLESTEKQLNIKIKELELEEKRTNMKNSDKEYAAAGLNMHSSLKDNNINIINMNHNIYNDYTIGDNDINHYYSSM